MKFLFLLFLAWAPPFIHAYSFSVAGLENGREKLPVEENQFIQPNSVLNMTTVYQGCGGVIPLSPVFNSYIQYKREEMYDPNEFCVWTLLPGDQVTNVRVGVWQNLTDSSDGIVAYFLNSTGLTSLKLPHEETTFDFNTPLAFLVFSSNSAAESNGFFMYIYSTGDSSTTSTSAYHVRKDEGEFSYPVEDHLMNRDEGMALVLQRKTTRYVQTLLEVKLENVSIGEKDSIQVYSFNDYSSSSMALIGRFTTQAKVQVPAFFPVLILLESETKNLTGKGFQVEWKPYMHSIQ